MLYPVFKIDKVPKGCFAYGKFLYDFTSKSILFHLKDTDEATENDEYIQRVSIYRLSVDDMKITKILTMPSIRYTYKPPVYIVNSTYLKIEVDRKLLYDESEPNLDETEESFKADCSIEKVNKSARVSDIGTIKRCFDFFSLKVTFILTFLLQGIIKFTVRTIYRIFIEIFVHHFFVHFKFWYFQIFDIFKFRYFQIVIFSNFDILIF